MKINEGFITNFLKNIMRGAISSKEKKFLRDNPEIANDVKNLKKSQDKLLSTLKKLGKHYD
tara:strand:- start:249 stop:431 length:183 start_codon:yes stop_codon:yes gene_type:complete